jgi:hypothetical protein
MLCNIILEEKKAEQAIKVAVANKTPSFTTDDILRDPSDPSKGVKSYLDETIKGVDAEGPIDAETQARRVLRRLNWVARTVIRKSGIRELNVRKLYSNIMAILEQYLSGVLRYSPEEIAEKKFNIAKEAAFIGNLLLAPSEKYPRAKGVFAPVTGDAGKTGKPNKVGVADRIAREFNMTVDDYISTIEPDLLLTIKEIIRNGPIKADKPEPKIVPETGEVDAEGATGEVATESVDNPDGVSLEDILKDPRIKGVYDPRIVRKVVKSMLDIGSVTQTAEGSLTLPEKGDEAWRQKYDKYRDEKASDTIEDIPSEEEMSELSPDEEESGPAEVEAEDEEEEKETADWGEELSKKRLGYNSGSRSEEEPTETTGEEDEDESEDAGKWYK